MAEPRRRAASGRAARPTGGDAPRPRGLGLWDRPSLLNLAADLCLLFGSTALAYAAFTWFLKQPLFPLGEVVVVTPPAQVTEEQLAYAARTAVEGNFFTVDLERVRETFEKLPWVRKAEVRRRWPDTLELRLEEHVAVAYWSPDGSGETRLVNRQGEVFIAASNATMPKLSGPEGTAAYVLNRFGGLLDAVAPLGKGLVEVTLSPREAWQLRLADGLVIQLGRDQESAPSDHRLRDFVHTFPEAQARAEMTVAEVDLRYPGGYVMRPLDGDAPDKARK
ncbi:MAG: cell division protein FtsQ/DivIB [Rhodocyclaceae bacterium]|nr:cell division protein FtsQ/DivIB [Rhodocyclaceae bacterium]